MLALIPLSSFPDWFLNVLAGLLQSTGILDQKAQFNYDDFRSGHRWCSGKTDDGLFCLMINSLISTCNKVN